MLYADIYVKEPIEKIADDWDFLDDKIIRKFSMFRPLGDNIYGIRAISHETPDSIGVRKASTDLVKTRKNLEIGPQGIVEVARTPCTVHVTLAGTPHHTQHMFGFWHINDKDEIIIPMPPSGTMPGYLLIIMGQPTENESDRFAWYCERCANLLFMREYVTGTAGFQGMQRCEHAAIAEYNNNVGHRTCDECGHINPLGYGGNSERDTPAEREARKMW